MLEARPKSQVFSTVIGEGETIWSDLDQQPGMVLVVGKRTEFGCYAAAPAEFSFTGLPAGLQGSATGLVSGVPKKAGAFNVQVTATFGDRVLEKVVRVIIRGEGPPAGIYWGFLDITEQTPHAGFVMLDVQTSGSFTGVVQTGTTRSPIAGTLPGEGIARSALTPLSGTSFAGFVESTGGPGSLLVYQWGQGNRTLLRGQPCFDMTQPNEARDIYWQRLPTPGRVYPDGFELSPSPPAAT